jgi:ABC-2 type transport system ATP-binding protein
MSVIETRDLSRQFAGGVAAVDGLTMRVEPGEIFAFLGPNGAGKTTTIRILVTLLKPTGGEATVAGHDVVREAGRVREKIGIALQEAALDPLMTGVECLDLQASLYGVPDAAARQRRDELLESVELVDAASRRVGTYSGGMRRRLDLAMALIHRPEVLFLDEPTTGLDPGSRQTIWERVRELAAAGTTIFLTTQYLEEADRLAGRVMIIDSGTAIAEGTPAQLKAEFGAPRIEITIEEQVAEAVLPRLARFGRARVERPGVISLATEGELPSVGAIAGAFEGESASVRSIEVVEPTLDDVFLARTGHQLKESAVADAAPSDERREAQLPGG